MTVQETLYKQSNKNRLGVMGGLAPDAYKVFVIFNNDALKEGA